MCGFVGRFGDMAKADLLRLPLRSIKHRGPDGCVMYEKPGFAIGYARLAILPPLSFSGLSRTSEDDVLALNGEIFYGADTLHERTDTNVLHDRIRQRGLVAELTDLRGLFALCRCNAQGLHLARDAFGIKPLYYAELPGGDVVFSSEMKALLAMKEIDKTLDHDVLVSFRVLGYNVFPGRTPFKKIKSVQPGTCVTFTHDSKKKISRFNRSMDRIDFSDVVYDKLKLSLHIEDLLRTSLRRNYMHDPNPKALFLSGGLDSACLLMQTVKLGKVEPFILWDGKHDDDFKDAVSLCKHFKCNPTVITSSIEEFDQAIVHYAWHFERPIGGMGFDLFGGVAFHILAQHIAGSGHRVAFCGEGADELFLGYHQYHMNPSILQQQLTETLTKSEYKSLKEQLQQLGVFSMDDELDHGMRYLAFRYGLAEYHLPSVDSSGMAFGLEIRPPYLDIDLVNFTNSLSGPMLIDRNENWTKLPLRALLQRHLTNPNIRSAIRRKRAMAYSLIELASKMETQIHRIAPKVTLSDLLWRLFFYLHVSQRFFKPPNVTFSELIPELIKLECPLCEFS